MSKKSSDLNKLNDENKNEQFVNLKMFFNEYKALVKKMFLLTKRKRTQTIIEFVLAYVFLILFLIMRNLTTRPYKEPLEIKSFFPHETLNVNSTTANLTLFYPDNLCTSSIVNNTINKLVSNIQGFPKNVQSISSPNLENLPNSTIDTIFAFIYFTNINNSCVDSKLLPEQIEYTLRMQENGLFYYRAQQVKLKNSDIYWKRSPEDYCQDNSTWLNYTTQFLGIQYFLDLSIIEYVNNVSLSLSSVSMKHFGCPGVYLDLLYGGFSFFIPLFYSIIYLVTFILNLGYIIEERSNKTKEYLRIFGLRTWVNNLVWITRSMIIYLILTIITSSVSIVSLSSGTKKAIFNYVDWTVIWTVLFVYSIEVSAFAVFFGQLFKRVLLAKLLGVVLWIVTFIDFYSGVPIGVRYFLCLFPNVGLLFCLQVMQQFERQNRTSLTFSQLYSNIFDYPLYIGLCLLIMLIYSVIYIFLAVYVERINPGEFGVAQSWNYFLKKSYWKSSPTQRETSTIKRTLSIENQWISLNSRDGSQEAPVLCINNLTKKYGRFTAVSNLSLDFYRGEVCTLLGHNGAGKTTTTFILVGMLEATSGDILIDGLDNRVNIEEVRLNLGFCPQYDILYDDLTVEEHLELIGKMRQMSEGALKQSTEEILDLIGLKNDRKTLSKNLSGGMKRRLSIGISLVNDPKVIILDEPTSGIDPYNRRLIWTIIRKLKGTGRCILLTTHFLEEADVLSDRIAIMSRGKLQANGTADFLKQRIDNEYRLIIDKEDQCSNDNLESFVRNYVRHVEIERQSQGELVFGIRRNQSKDVENLISAVDQNKENLRIKSYGLQMTTIEDVFLKLIEEEEKQENQESLDEQIFRRTYRRLNGTRLFFHRLWALIIKRWHVSRRQLSLFFGFFFLTLLIEILCVSVVPTPQELQSLLLQNERVNNAEVLLDPSIYDPQTIVTYSNENTSVVRNNLQNYLSKTGATVLEISQGNLTDYVRNRYLESERIFIDRYQIGFDSFFNSSTLEFGAHFSTVNYHTMPTSLNVATNNLFQFYSNSTNRRIVAKNQPILTESKSSSYIAGILPVLYCFEVFPVSLFGFLNSILATIFISVLLLNLINERVKNWKNLQLLTNVSRFTYWFSNWLFDMSLCFILCALLTIIIKIGAEANPKNDAEVRIYKNNQAAGYFFCLYFLYTLASLPLAYSYSFRARTSILGLTNFFIINVIASVIDAVINSFTVFSQNATPMNGPSSSYKVVSIIRWILAAALPSVNLKHALYNSQLHENPQCIRTFNIYIGTKFRLDEPWSSLEKTAVGAEILVFCLQMIFWTFILILIESRRKFRRNRRSSRVAQDFFDWNDQHLDEDVRTERQLIVNDKKNLVQSSVVVVSDLVKQFQKGKSKKLYTAVDHLNFYVQQRACFGLLGANGAGKTTTFRMMINEIQPSAGQILLNGMSVNDENQDFEIGFCPQFDWLVEDLTVDETIRLFARLKGIQSEDIEQTSKNMMKIFGLEIYDDRLVQRLSGGNKRKVSTAIAFMANPTLVFLDEPTTGLDAAAKRKLWRVIRSARDLGLTIIMTSHSMEECEALCSKVGIMKSGQFICLGTLKHLKTRFSKGYEVQIKVGKKINIDQLKSDLTEQLVGLEILDQYSEQIFCSVPFSNRSTSLIRIFEVLNRKKEQNLIESFSLTQTSLEQIFVQLAGEDEEIANDQNSKRKEPKKAADKQSVITRF